LPQRTAIRRLNRPANSIHQRLKRGLMMHRIAVAGASGRMGQMLVDAVRAADDCQLTGALDQFASPAIGRDAGSFSGQPTGVLINSDLRSGLQNSQVLIDFTRPEGTMAHLAVCREMGLARVFRCPETGNCRCVQGHRHHDGAQYERGRQCDP